MLQDGDLDHQEDGVVHHHGELPETGQRLQLALRPLQGCQAAKQEAKI